jgi:hypothetical protein
MGGEPPQKPEPSGDAAAPPQGKHNGDPAFSGSKPGRNGRRLSDEEAFAELQRRQRERARRS